MNVKERDEIHSLVIFTPRDKISISDDPIVESEADEIITLSTGKRVGVKVYSTTTNYGHYLARREYVSWTAHPIK